MPELQLMNQEVIFSDTKVGQVTQVKIEFKNSLDHNVDLEAEAPKPPFRIKHRTFKITLVYTCHLLQGNISIYMPFVSR